MILISIWVTKRDGQRVEIRPPLWMTRAMLRELVAIYRSTGFTSIYPVRHK